MTTLRTGVRLRTSATTITDPSLPTAADRDFILRVLADPTRHGPEVAKAVELLVSVGRSSATFAPREGSGSVNERFDSIVELLQDALQEMSEGATYTHEDIPHYVPEGWADFLSVDVVDDPEFRAPWLDELGE